MITLLLFLFIAGGQKKPVKPAPHKATTLLQSEESWMLPRTQPEPVTQYSDGCNTTTCRGDMCTQTLAACIKADDPGVVTPIPVWVPAIPAEPLGSPSGDKRYEYLDDEMLGSPDGSRVVKLSDAEYTHLQELRKAVVDEEKRLAVKYGADVTGCHPSGDSFCVDPRDKRQAFPSWDADHYEYHGQFLLIEKGK